MDPLEDDPLFLARLRRREERAFTELVRAWQGRVFGLTYRMLGDRGEAEDLSQEVFVTVFKAIDSFRGDSRLGTWILRIATNHCHNRLKYLTRRHHKRKRDIDDVHEVIVDHPLSQPPQQPERALEGAQLGRLVHEGLQQLDEDHRVVLILRDIEQLSYTEIAEILEVAEGTVKSRLFRARTSLRDRIARRYQP
jgi:RNA polymerase sigma-70 factor (ECF subfamily)